MYVCCNFTDLSVRSIVEVHLTTAAPLVSRPERFQKKTIRLRIITPALALAYKDWRCIPILKSSITTRSTLGDVRNLVSGHLRSSFEHTVPELAECNCVFAKHVLWLCVNDRNEYEATTSPGGKVSFKLILLYGRNLVHILEALALGSDELSLREKVTQWAGKELIASKKINFFGGKRDK